MGKTLSILALVTKTLTEAQKWASEHIADDVDSVLLAKKRTLATLVIVPSARKWPSADTPYSMLTM